MSRKMKVIMWILIVIVLIFIIMFGIGTYLKYKDKQNASREPVNRDDYVLYSFQLDSSSGNDMSTDGKTSHMFWFYGETLVVETPEMKKSKEKELSAEERKNLEADLLALIETHNLIKWDGYDEYLPIPDASNSFSLRIKYQNEEKEIKANGSFMFPDNYGEVFSAVEEVFLKHHDFYELGE